MPAEDSTNLDHLLTEQVYPALYGTLETAFPEFEWTQLEKEGLIRLTAEQTGYSLSRPRPACLNYGMASGSLVSAGATALGFCTEDESPCT